MSEIPIVVKVLGVGLVGLAAVIVVLLVLASLWATSIESRRQEDRPDGRR